MKTKIREKGKPVKKKETHENKGKDVYTRVCVCVCVCVTIDLGGFFQHI